MSIDTLGDYLRQIGRHPLLTAAEEIELARMIWAAAQTKAAITGEPTKEQRIVLRRGDRARRRMIEGNLRLVVSAARQQARSRRRESLDLLDLISHGNLGLVTAVERFDHTRGYKFSTYAFWWIRQAINRGIANEDRPIRLPIHVIEGQTRMNRAIADAMREGRLLSLEAAAEQARLNVDTARRVLQVQSVQSLDASISSLDDGCLLQVLADPNQGASANALVDDPDAMLEVMLHRLDPRSRQLVIGRYGLDGRDAKTLKELGETYGITRERTRQLIQRALLQMRGVHRYRPNCAHRSRVSRAA